MDISLLKHIDVNWESLLEEHELRSSVEEMGGEIKSIKTKPSYVIINIIFDKDADVTDVGDMMKDVLDFFENLVAKFDNDVYLDVVSSDKKRKIMEIELGLDHK